MNVNRSNSRPPRRGLAPLELVLALPILLFVMALILNMGTVGAWKVRAQVNGRYAAWRQAEARSGLGSDPNPYGWQAGSLSNSAQPALSSVVPDWSTLPTPPTEQLVLGPVVADPQTGTIIVIDRQLEMWEGSREGSASQTRRYPLLPDMGGGQYRPRAATELLDNAWEFHGLGYGNNADRRADRWWRLDPQNFPDPTNTAERDLAHQMLIAAMAALPDPENPGYFMIDPLDHDPNLVRLPQVNQPPEFHPPARNTGQYDPDVIRNHGPAPIPANARYQNLDPNDRNAERNALLSRIRRLPGSMAQEFISRYTTELNRLQTPPQPGQPPPAPGPYSIAQLQEWINQLNDFRNSLPPQHK
ncbi:MAG: hypothetical protein WD066_05105 [Planctomycetaceae bacterium]